MALVALNAAAVCAVLTAARPAAGDEREWRVFVAIIRDESRQASISKIRQRIESALRAQRGVAMASRRAWLRAVNRHDIPPDRWLEPWALRRLTQGLQLSAVLIVELNRRPRRGFRFILRAVDPASGTELARVSRDVTRPRMTRSSARFLAQSLVSALSQQTAVPAVAEPTTGPGSQAPDGRPAEKPEESAETVAEATPDEVEGAKARGEELEEAGRWGEELEFDEVTEDDLKTAMPLELAGRVEVEHFSYYKDLGPEKIPSRNSVDFAFEAKAGTSQSFAVGGILVRHDFSDRSRRRLEAEQAYAHVTRSWLTLRGGRMQVTWGAASLVNPSDILNPVDMRDPLDIEKLPTWMIRLGIVAGPALLEVYYLPVPESSLVPFPDSIDAENRLRGRSRWVAGSLGDPGPLPLVYELGAVEPPPPRLRHAQGAARLAATLAGIDVAFCYAYLHDRWPTLRATPTVAEPPTHVDVALRAEFPRIHAVAADLEGTVGKLRLAAEVLGVLTEDHDDTDDEVENPYVKAVVGFDFRTSQFWVDHSVHFYVDLLTTHALVGELPEGVFGQLRHPFHHAVLARVAYEVGGAARFAVNAVSSMTAYDVLVQPQVELLFDDKVTARLGTQLLMGDRKNFFGRFQKNSRVVLSLTSTF